MPGVAGAETASDAAVRGLDIRKCLSLQGVGMEKNECLRTPADAISRSGTKQTAPGPPGHGARHSTGEGRGLDRRPAAWLRPPGGVVARRRSVYNAGPESGAASLLRPWWPQTVKIACILTVFPSMSETFVFSDLRALREAGHELGLLYFLDRPVTQCPA